MVVKIFKKKKKNRGKSFSQKFQIMINYLKFLKIKLIRLNNHINAVRFFLMLF